MLGNAFKSSGLFTFVFRISPLTNSPPVRTPRFLIILGLLLGSLFFFNACGDDAASTASSTATAPAAPPIRPKDPNAKKVPAFNMDSAYAYVAAQVAFGPRVPNTPAHDQTAEWLVSKLKEFGAQVEEQKFPAMAYTGTELRGNNIIGRYNPEMTDRILLCAHWDTRHIADSKLAKPGDVVEGADDGASGVGVLLEIARQLGMSTPSIGVDIVMLDLEDYGEGGGSGNSESWALGSQYYSRNFSGPKHRYGILLDMVGGKNATFRREAGSLKYAPRVVDKVWKLAAGMGYGTYFPMATQRAVLDDHVFINTIARIPTIDIINYREETESKFVAHWHTGNDGMNTIDKRSLRAVGQVVTAVVYREAAGTL